MKIAKYLLHIVSFLYFIPCQATLVEDITSHEQKTPTKPILKEQTKDITSYEQKTPMRLLLEEQCEILLHILTFTECAEHLAMEQVSNFTNIVTKNAWILKTEEHKVNPRDLKIFLDKKRKLTFEINNQSTEENKKEELQSKIVQEAKKTVIRDAWIKKSVFYFRFNELNYLKQGFDWLIKACNSGSSYAHHQLLDQFLNHFYLIAKNRNKGLCQEWVKIVQKSKEDVKNFTKKRLKALKNSNSLSSDDDVKKKNEYYLRLAKIEHLESKLLFTLDDSPLINRLIEKGLLKAAFFKKDHYRYIPKDDANQLILKSATNGNAKAQLYHALKLLEQDKIDEATNFLTLSANQNNAEALYMRGVIELLNTHSTKAFSLLQNATRDSQSQYDDLQLISKYYQINIQGAQKILLHKALQGRTEVKDLLGILICEEDTQTAQELISKAAILGHPDAQYLWGIRLLYTNSQAAPKMIFLAALQGQANALFVMSSHRYKNGDLEGAKEFITYANNLGYYIEKSFLIRIQESLPKETSC